MSELTPNLGLSKPADNDIDWGDEYRGAMDILDANPGIKVVADTTALGALTGNWLGRLVYQADINEVFKWTGAAFAPENDPILTTKGDLLVFAATLARLTIGANNTILQAKSTEAAGMKWVQNTRGISFYIDGVLATTLKTSFEVPCGLTVTGVNASVDVAPTGANLILDVHKNGVTMFTTQANRPTIVAGALQAPAVVPDITSLAERDIVEINIDQKGSTLAGSNLRVTVKCEVV